MPTHLTWNAKNDMKVKYICWEFFVHVLFVGIDELSLGSFELNIAYIDCKVKMQSLKKEYSLLLHIIQTNHALDKEGFTCTKIAEKW